MTPDPYELKLMSNIWKGIFGTSYELACSDLRIYRLRVFHKWTKDKKWKERWRAGCMTILELKEDFNSALEDDHASHKHDLFGAN